MNTASPMITGNKGFIRITSGTSYGTPIFLAVDAKHVWGCAGQAIPFSNTN
jgi:hypothetical protein